MVAPTLQPTLSLEPHLHQEFTFAEDTNSGGCCCFWRSRSAKPQEYYVNSNHTFERFRLTEQQVESRIRANQRLAEILQSKLKDDPIGDNAKFEELRQRVNHDFREDPITSEKLEKIVSILQEMRNATPSPTSSSN